MDMIAWNVLGALWSLPMLISAWALVRVVRNLDAQVANTTTELLIGRFRWMLMSFVREQDQTVVDPRKKARAADSRDGPLLTKHEQRSFARSTVDKLRNHLDSERLATIVQAFGIDPENEHKVHGFLLSQVESSVSRLKFEKAIRELIEPAPENGEAEGPFEGAFEPR